MENLWWCFQQLASGSVVSLWRTAYGNMHACETSRFLILEKYLSNGSTYMQQPLVSSFSVYSEFDNLIEKWHQKCLVLYYNKLIYSLQMDATLTSSASRRSILVWPLLQFCFYMVDFGINTKHGCADDFCQWLLTPLIYLNKMIRLDAHWSIFLWLAKCTPDK